MRKKSKMKQLKKATASPYDMLVDKLSKLPENEFDMKFDQMLDQMNMRSADIRATLQKKEKNAKIDMLAKFLQAQGLNVDDELDATTLASARSDGCKAPMDFSKELLELNPDSNNFLHFIQELSIHLKSEPILWIEQFIDEGLPALFKTIDHVLHRKDYENDTTIKRILIELVKSVTSIMNCPIGLNRVVECITWLETIAMCINPNIPNAMLESVRLMAAVSLIDHEKTLTSISVAAKKRNIPRFNGIISGLNTSYHVNLNIGCIVLVNALITGAVDGDLRIHLRNEFSRCGIITLIEPLKALHNERLDVQISIFEESMENDAHDIQARFYDMQISFDNIEDIYKLLYNISKNTPSETYLLSILQHLLFIRADDFIRTEYFRLIEEVVSQIVLQKNGVDPDFTCTKLSIDVDHLLEEMCNADLLDQAMLRLTASESKLSAEMNEKQELQAKLNILTKECGEKTKRIEDLNDEFEAQKVKDSIISESLTTGLDHDIKSKIVVVMRRTLFDAIDSNTRVHIINDVTQKLYHNSTIPDIQSFIEKIPSATLQDTIKFILNQLESIIIQRFTASYNLKEEDKMESAAGSDVTSLNDKVKSLKDLLKDSQNKLAESRNEIIALKVTLEANKLVQNKVNDQESLPPPPPPPLPGAAPPPPPPLPGAAPPPPPPLPGAGPPPPPCPPGGVPRPPGAPAPPGAPSAPAGPVNPKKQYKPALTTKRLNWNQLNMTKVIDNKDGFWANANEEELENNQIFDDIIDKFGVKKSPPKTTNVDAAITKKKTKEPKVVDGNTIQNISIFLGRIKCSYEDIKKKFLSVEKSFVTENLIENFIKFIPPVEMRLMLEEYKGSEDELPDAELFVLTMATIPRLDQRLVSLSLMMKFPEQIGDVKPQLTHVIAACKEVKSSEKFQKVLKLILLFGNYMNAGSRNARTMGFDLHFLRKLRDTKTADNQKNFLHFLNETLESTYPDTIGFDQDLSSVNAASKISADEVMSVVNNLQGTIKNVENESKFHENAKQVDPNDLFYDKISEFLADAKQKVLVLTEMHSTMKLAFDEIIDFFSLDTSKFPMDEFFSVINDFIIDYQKAAGDNKRHREKEEREAKFKAMKEAEANKRAKRQNLASGKTNIPGDVDGTKKGVIDGLLNSLETGKAFRGSNYTSGKSDDSQGGSNTTSASNVENSGLLVKKKNPNVNYRKEKTRTMGKKSEALFSAMLKEMNINNPETKEASTQEPEDMEF